jgi:hypothetical protein
MVRAWEGQDKALAAVSNTSRLVPLEHRKRSKSYTKGTQKQDQDQDHDKQKTTKALLATVVCVKSCVELLVGCKKQKGEGKRTNGQMDACLRGRCSSVLHDYVLTRTVHGCSPQALFKATDCSVGSWIRSNPGVGPAVQLPRLLFFRGRRFNRPQPVRGRPGLSSLPLFMRSKEMCESTVVNGFVMNTERDCLGSHSWR